MDILRASGGFINDYLNDLLFFGLKENLQENVVDSTPILPLYSEYNGRIDPRHFWGGMTSFWLLDKDTSNRESIEEKIKSNFYDYIVYGSIKRCRQYYDLVSKCYSHDKIILVDGDDDTIIDPLCKYHKYFKRELIHKDKNLFPISFGFPTHKLSGVIETKRRPLATCIPGYPITYVFKQEKDYYLDYQQSVFGITRKKAGWDCMRHYEILANYCMPFFEDIEQCPETCLNNFPKQMLIDAKKLMYNFDPSQYFSLMRELYSYTENNLTTKQVAKRFLERIVN